MASNEQLIGEQIISVVHNKRSALDENENGGDMNETN